MLSSWMSQAPLAYADPPQASEMLSIQVGITQPYSANFFNMATVSPRNSYLVVLFNLNSSKLAFHALPHDMLFFPLFFHTTLINITEHLVQMQDKPSDEI